MNMVTRLRKQLRILWAALTQRWEQQTCSFCQSVWRTSLRHDGPLCPACEAARFEAISIQRFKREAKRGAV
jgi:hypothetical protein